MIDELPINMTCKPMQVLGRKTYEADFSFLNKYQNVHFIICFHPAAGTNDFELIFPSEQPGQLYKLLGSRYRNAQMILEFLRFWQNICSSDYKSYAGLLSLQNEENLDSEVLPPLFECYNYGVIWIPIPICNLKGSCPILSESLIHNYVVKKIKTDFSRNY